MLCPYLTTLTIITKQGTKNDQEENKNTLVETQVQTFSHTECTKENCGAWQNGECKYNKK